MRAVAIEPTSRQALAARKINTASLGRDLGISGAELDAWLAERLKLSADDGQADARFLFPHAEFVPELDKLRSAASRNEPKPMGSPPPPITESLKLPVYQAGPAQAAPRPLKDCRPVTAAPRPGWAE